MDPKKVTRDFSPPEASKTIVHEIPHQNKLDVTGASNSEVLNSLSSNSGQSGEENIKKRKYKPLPQLLPEEIAEEKRKLKKQKKNMKRINKREKISKEKNWFKIIISIVIILFAIMGIVFLYLLGTGAIMPSFNQTINPEFNFDAPITADFEPITNNEYQNEYTIVNNITCPEQVCYCGDEE